MPYSYLSAVLSELAKQATWGPDVRAFCTDLFRGIGAVESAGGDLHYFYAISTQDGSFSAFCSLSVQIITFCKIRGVPAELGPKICLFHGRATWDAGAVWDAREDAAYDVHRAMLSSGIAVHEGEVSTLLKIEPRLADVRRQCIERVTNTSGSMIALDVWSVVGNTPQDDGLLLRGPAATHLVVAVDQGLAAMIASLAKVPRDLARLSSYRVEELIAELLHDQGYHVEVTAKTRDGGRDIIAIRRSSRELLPEQKYLIEVKHPKSGNPVRIEAVRALVGVGHIDPSTGLVLATTTRFTTDAKRFAADSTLRYRMSLREFDDLIAWIRTYASKRGGDV